MAVTAKMYKHFPYLCASGSVIIPTTATASRCVRVALFTSKLPPNQQVHRWFNASPYATDTYSSKVAGGAGYSAAGSRLTSVTATCSNTASLIWRFDGADTTWTGISASSRYAVVYASGYGAGQPLICYVDFGATQNPSGGNFTLQWSAGGLVQATIA